MGINTFRHYVIPVFIPHWGCPHRCVFCDQGALSAVWRLPSSQQVTKIISSYLKTIPADAKRVELAYYGGSFTALSEAEQIRLLEPAKPFLQEGSIHAIRVSTRPDYIDQNILERLKRYGISTVELGVQSMDPDVLQKSGRGHTPQDVRMASWLIKKYGIGLGLQLMPGLPGDSEAKAIASVYEVIRLNPNFVRIYPTVVLKGTQLHRMFVEGKYHPLSLVQTVNWCVKMYLLFQRARIPVIRMGLQASQELTAGCSLIAGPFHPAFGEMVKSAAAKQQLAMAIQDLWRSSGITRKIRAYVNPRQLSILIGQRRKNIQELRNQFNLQELNVINSPHLVEDAIGVSSYQSNEPELVVSREEFINKIFPEEEQ